MTCEKQRVQSTGGTQRFPVAGAFAATITVLGLVLAGCGASPEQDRRRADPGNAPAPRLDMAVTTSSDTEAAQHLLVTMTDAQYETLLSEPARFDGGLPAAYATFISQLSEQYSVQRVADWPLSTLGIRCLVFESLDSRRLDDTVKALREDARIETVQVMHRFQTLQSAESRPYNDPYLALQHSFSSMDVPAAHRFATGKGVRVAVIDTGVDIDHTDLATAIGTRRNMVDRDDEVFRQDIHGTAVAAVIAAAVDNRVGIAGVAPDVEILALKACWQAQPRVRAASCNSYTLAKALNFAVAQGVDIINLSLGGPSDALLERLVKKALAGGALVVGAINADIPDGFPSGVDGVLVASSNPARTAGQALSARTVYAPGRNVISARPGDKYAFFDGSSLSAAHLSGLLALMRERRPHLSVDDALAALRKSNEVPSDTVNADVGESFNACAALAALVDAGSCRRGTND